MGSITYILPSVWIDNVPDVAIDKDGNINVCYSDSTGLVYAKRIGSVWVKEKIGSATFSSMAVDYNGNPNILMQDSNTGDLIYSVLELPTISY